MIQNCFIDFNFKKMRIFILLKMFTIIFIIDKFQEFFIENFFKRKDFNFQIFLLLKKFTIILMWTIFHIFKFFYRNILISQTFLCRKLKKKNIKFFCRNFFLLIFLKNIFIFIKNIFKIFIVENFQIYFYGKKYSIENF